MKNRQAENSRRTKETNIYTKINIDGSGTNTISTRLPFFDHMLEQLSKHSLIDLELNCIGDLEIDAHHTVLFLQNPQSYNCNFSVLTCCLHKMLFSYC